MGGSMVFKPVVAGSDHVATQQRPASPAAEGNQPTARAKRGTRLRPSQVPVSGPADPVVPARLETGNVTGLPDSLKSGIEALSGLSLDDVRVHYDSGKPVQVGALAVTQGTDIHVGPAQENHLAHEAWHVVQQKREQLRPTTRAGGEAVNDDLALEAEADRVGRTYQSATARPTVESSGLTLESADAPRSPVMQRTIPAADKSNERLKAIYDELVKRSPMLRILGDIVGKDRPITLQFVPDEELGPAGAAYESEEHRIIVNAKYTDSPKEEIKELILIELNHARGVAHPILETKVDPRGTLSEEKKVDLEWAFAALRAEYGEWISVYLSHIQTSDVNTRTEKGELKSAEEMSSPEIKPMFADLYPSDGTGWYNFTNYLLDQRNGGHTDLYDPKAKDDDWVGLTLLKKAEESFGDAFLIKDIMKSAGPTEVTGHTAKPEIDIDRYKALLARADPFAGPNLKSLIDAYVADLPNHGEALDQFGEKGKENPEHLDEKEDPRKSAEKHSASTGDQDLRQSSEKRFRVGEEEKKDE
jgi:Domain of unknown function (DUF4157)